MPVKEIALDEVEDVRMAFLQQRYCSDAVDEFVRRTRTELCLLIVYVLLLLALLAGSSRPANVPRSTD
jgi:hypothetical protein